jgi:signal transduction histidine kinase
MPPQPLASILIVDDRQENLAAMEALLAGPEVELVTALSGSEALRHTLKTNFALVILDVQMPEMDGFETAEWLRSNPKTRHLPIIFVTAGMREDFHQFKGYGAGAVDYLIKPIEPAVLRSKVQVFCDLARQRHQIEQHERHLEERVRERTAELSAALAALSQREAELQQANRNKDEFLATLAHELRNPLAPVRTGAFLLLKRGAQDPETMQIYELIHRQTAHMARMVDDLLEVTRIERGKVELRREPVDVGQVLVHAVEVCRPLVQERNHQLALALPDHLPPLDADPVRLEQMLCNLLNNACKYTPKGGKIQISASTEGHELVLCVRDNGIGMLPEVVRRVFEPFYQAGRHLDRSELGLGIGLTLVKQLAGLHGGSVSATSDGPGMGSAFRLRLPVLEPGLLPVPSSGAPPLADRGKGQAHVLIIDDDPSVRTTEEMLLKAMGFQVSVAASGEQGVRLALALRPEIAIIDLGMPGMGGLEVASRIREELGPHIHMIALTGYSRESDMAMTKAAGFDQHLIKSGDPKDLIQALNGIR